MHIKKVKLNNSYTTYIVVEDGEETYHVAHARPQKEAKWKPGCKVFHTFHGQGVVSKMNNHQIVVRFSNSKVLRNAREFTISFRYLNSPREIDNLKLCM